MDDGQGHRREERVDRFHWTVKQVPMIVTYLKTLLFDPSFSEGDPWAVVMPLLGVFAWSPYLIPTLTTECQAGSQWVIFFYILVMTRPEIQPTTYQSQNRHSIFLPFSPIWAPAAFLSGRHQVEMISQSLNHRWVEIQQKECYFWGGRGLFVSMWNHAATQESVLLVVSPYLCLNVLFDVVTTNCWNIKAGSHLMTCWTPLLNGAVKLCYSSIALSLWGSLLIAELLFHAQTFSVCNDLWEASWLCAS